MANNYYDIPITWKMIGFIRVQADSIEEALRLAKKCDPTKTQISHPKLDKTSVAITNGSITFIPEEPDTETDSETDSEGLTDVKPAQPEHSNMTDDGKVLIVKKEPKVKPPKKEKGKKTPKKKPPKKAPKPTKPKIVGNIQITDKDNKVIHEAHARVRCSNGKIIINVETRSIIKHLKAMNTEMTVTFISEDKTKRYIAYWRDLEPFVNVPPEDVPPMPTEE